MKADKKRFCFYPRSSALAVIELLARRFGLHFPVVRASHTKKKQLKLESVRVLGDLLDPAIKLIRKPLSSASAWLLARRHQKRGFDFACRRIPVYSTVSRLSWEVVSTGISD